MARKVDPKAVASRIKENKATMKACKKIVADGMVAAMKGGDYDGGEVRLALSTLIKSDNAVRKDSAKLQ